MDTVSEEEDFGACVTYRKAKRAKKEGASCGDNGKHEQREASEEGRARDGFNRKTGERDTCYFCSSEYHFAPQRPQKGNLRGGPPPPSRPTKQIPEIPYSVITMKSSLEVRPS